MPLQHAVLALLNSGPTYGYDLRRRFETAVGPQWGGLNVGHLNQILERLRRDGLVETTPVPTTWGPDRVVHEITDDGLSVLDDWMKEPTVRSAGFRDDFILKVLAAGLQGQSALTEVCAVQRDARSAELHSLLAAREVDPDDALTGLVIQAAVLHVRAELKLIDEAENLAVDSLARIIAPPQESEQDDAVTNQDLPAEVERGQLPSSGTRSGRDRQVRGSRRRSG